MAEPTLTAGLLAILDNQMARTAAALEDLPDAAFAASPGGDCNAIRLIGVHLLRLRQFQLELLGRADLGGRIDISHADETATELLSRLTEAGAIVRQAIMGHDSNDWLAEPTTPRPGPWGEEPTLSRVVRPINDFTNHLGGIRAIRRILACPAKRTQ